ncbi:hypothetical protein BT63DRAFT_81625 [Microthyrium microscopicum]|uniref:Uncharacterized protein n=1 Tax=Microthyrium microscopicum TaxID=703497 RepID=A0A6A6TZ57_9PEZI|nr:hypothetical protein BT63DRAFT_81625 [Microthyrium microscopicum]
MKPTLLLTILTVIPTAITAPPLSKRRALRYGPICNSPFQNMTTFQFKGVASCINILLNSADEQCEASDGKCNQLCEMGDVKVSMRTYHGPDGGREVGHVFELPCSDVGKALKKVTEVCGARGGSIGVVPDDWGVEWDIGVHYGLAWV